MTTDSTSTRPPEAAHTPPAPPHVPEGAAAGSTVTEQPGGLRSNTLGSWEVFAQGLAAAAPSVAVASVPFALYTAAGKGAAWAAIIGLVIAVLLATTISFQARRTVSSGSLGTYTGNGLGPAFAFVGGFSLLIGYVGFSVTGTLGGVLYVDSFLLELGIGSEASWFRLLLVFLVVGLAVYLPIRGASLAAKYELVFEVIALISIAVIIVAAYVSYGWHFDTEQWSLSNLGHSSTFVAAVTAVGAYAGFESVASLGAEARDAHRSISKALLRVVLIIGVLYIIATYPQVLHFDGINGDKAILPQLADSSGVGWVKPVTSAAVAVAFIVFVTAVTSSAARSLFTFAHEGALPRVFAKVHSKYHTPWVGVAFVGAAALVFSIVATFSSAGRTVFDVYGAYVTNWGFLVSYLLVVIATPIWLYKIKALTPFRAIVSGLAVVALGYVIVNNLYPVPEFPFNILPFVYLAILAAGVAWYVYLRVTRPEIAARIGTIQTLTAEEQERLADADIAEELQADDFKSDERQADEFPADEPETSSSVTPK